MAGDSAPHFRDSVAELEVEKLRLEKARYQTDVFKTSRSMSKHSPS